MLKRGVLEQVEVLEPGESQTARAAQRKAETRRLRFSTDESKESKKTRTFYFMRPKT